MDKINKKVTKIASLILLCLTLVISQTAYQTTEGQTSTLEYQLWHDLNTPLSNPIGSKFGWTNVNTPGSSVFGSFLSWGSKEDDYGAQIFINYHTPEFWYRQIENGTTSGWKKLVHSDSPTFTGNVGIGTTTPNSMLDVNGEIRGTKLHVFNNVMDAAALVIQGATISNDNRFHYVALSFDGDYGNATGNYSQIRSYSNLYSMWGSSLSFHTTADNTPNTLVERMRILYNGNVGIGTAQPFALLHSAGAAPVNLPSAGSANGVGLAISNSDRNYGITMGTASSGTGWIQQMRMDGNTELYNLILQPIGGSVGIGTTSPGIYKLNVSGTIRANEVVVNTAGADFVFDSDYNLPELSDVEKFVKENKHLPDILPATEMQKCGMNVSEMQTKLLQKIEELTLYVIELKKEITELKKNQ